LLTFTIIVPFDHNGVFHLAQLPGLFCLFFGVQESVPSTKTGMVRHQQFKPDAGP
jgi:hypothetical protein